MYSHARAVYQACLKIKPILMSTLTYVRINVICW